MPPPGPISPKALRFLRVAHALCLVVGLALGVFVLVRVDLQADPPGSGHDWITLSMPNSVSPLWFVSLLMLLLPTAPLLARPRAPWVFGAAYGIAFLLAPILAFCAWGETSSWIEGLQLRSFISRAQSAVHLQRWSWERTDDGTFDVRVEVISDRDAHESFSARTDAERCKDTSSASLDLARGRTTNALIHVTCSSGDPGDLRLYFRLPFSPREIVYDPRTLEPRLQGDWLYVPRPPPG